MNRYVGKPASRLLRRELTGYIGITETKAAKPVPLSNVVTFPK
jgi:hypothetical protein